MFSWRGFCLSPGPPFLPPAFLSLPVITTCSSCPHGIGLCSRKQGRGRVGGRSCITKAGHWPRASSHRGSEPGGRGGGTGPPTCSHSSPSQAAFLPALAAWPPERNLPFRAWLSLAKTYIHCPVSSNPAIVFSIFLVVKQYHILWLVLSC